MQASPLPRTLLTFGPSDPTGGAGIQGDLLTCAALGVWPLSVLTGQSVRDTAHGETLAGVEGEWVADQARALLEDMPVHAFKIGQPVTVEIAAEIAEILGDYPDVPVVLDVELSRETESPVDDDMLDAFSQWLMPLATLTVISAQDALRLATDEDDEDEEAPLGSAEAARMLIDNGCPHVLITGAHEHTGQVINTLYGTGGVLRTDAWERLPGPFHGAGATLSTAIAVLLAHGMEITAAVHAAQSYTWQTLAQCLRPGMGRCLPNRFCEWKR